MKSIDWTSLNEVVVDGFGPAIETIAEALGGIIETPLVSGAIIGTANAIVFGLESIAAIFTGDWTTVLDMGKETQWLVDFRTGWYAFWDAFSDITGIQTDAERARSDEIYQNALLNEPIEDLDYALPGTGVGQDLGVDYLTGAVGANIPAGDYATQAELDWLIAKQEAELLAQDVQAELLYETKITNERLERILEREDYRYR